MFTRGDIVYVKDIDGCIYEGEVLDVGDARGSYYVGYETDYYFKTIWVSERILSMSFFEVSKNAAFIY